ncbi:molybdopterin-synthase adenylyltransferase MoeB [Aliiglaciecola sp. CAU 1673]|uniref:HesA/MoeB/ThiF family protein n=1 Tax=Aliiglaciecola sp. CAU 1673 TaxID=3032595 RepID=UPI0023DB259B|nr:molybdopterin-synthase adenylyltransferase MoeB [Aliiglaciecola sp. CAU 1673]MDF2177423.1 molybdopterin-synthase adenylyltransferase MoeB [Aliiglaciecola sp. CAU 1673]
MPKSLTLDQALRYNRQILLPGFDLDAQEVLLNAAVLQIGVGGLGNPAAQYLVGAGIGALTLCDDDKVESSNLARQVLFSEADLGRGKCEAALDRLQSLNHQCRLKGIPKRLDEAALSAQIMAHDLVLDCSDNLATRQLISKLCVRFGKPLVSGAAIRFEGQLFSYAPGKDCPCYQCLSALFGEQQLSCVEAGILAPVVGIIGVMQALEAVKLLTGIGQASLGRLQLFDGLQGRWQEFKVLRRPDCPICSV